MSRTTSPAAPALREKLNRDRVIAAAVALADDGGLEALTMRNLAQEFSVVPMALYKHVAHKDELLGFMVDVVFSEIDLNADRGWRLALRDRAVSMRAALLRHPWAIGLMESGGFGPAQLQDHETVMRCLREDAGLTFPMALHALSLLDSFIYGFALQQKVLDRAGDDQPSVPHLDGRMPSHSDEYPYVTELLREVARSGYDYGEEFRFGLEVLLDGIEGMRSD